MLVKSDLEQIGKLVRKVVREEVEAEVKDSTHTLDSEIRMSRMRIQHDIGELDNRMKNVEVRLDNVQKEIKETIVTGLEPVKKDMKYLKKKVNRIDKTVHVMAKLFETEDVLLNKRVAKIEAHLGLASKN